MSTSVSSTSITPRLEYSKARVARWKSDERDSPPRHARIGLLGAAEPSAGPPRAQTAVLCVWMRTFFTLPLRLSVGLVPLKPGFWMPMPLPSGRGRGFLSEERSGLRVTEDADDSVVLLVSTEDMLPLACDRAYGLPLASVTEMPPPWPPPATATTTGTR